MTRRSSLYVLLLAIGFSKSRSLGAGVASAVGGPQPDRVIWLVCVGAVAVIAGIAGLMRGAKP